MIHTIEIEPTRIYKVEDARVFLTNEGVDADAIGPQVDVKFMSCFCEGNQTAGPVLRSELLCSGPLPHMRPTKAARLAGPRRPFYRAW